MEGGLGIPKKAKTLLRNCTIFVSTLIKNLDMPTSNNAYFGGTCYFSRVAAIAAPVHRVSPPMASAEYMVSVSDRVPGYLSVPGT